MTAPLSVEAARMAILADLPVERPAETVPLAQALNRTLAQDLNAQLTQPPRSVSAMDGYAVRAKDLAESGGPLKLIGESRAGHGFAGKLGPGEAVRIFTGAPMPEGADAVLIQEDTRAEAGLVTALRKVESGCFVRAKGLDFTAGDRLLEAGTRLGPLELGLAAAMNHAELAVVRRPRVAILATGDELVPPGKTLGPEQIVASNSFAIAALVETAGGEPVELGIAHDDLAALAQAIAAARSAEADVLVTLGGASVGDYDLIKPALIAQGMELSFWRIAMRPGRPLIHGRLGPMQILGLPGNPVSAIVAGVIFLLPLIRALLGDPNAAVETFEPALLGASLRANDGRRDYLRAALTSDETGLLVATPFLEQDSSLLGVLARADCLLIREPGAPAAKKGDPCRILRLPGKS
jgi:molybdopterin molybdotransferase